MSFTKYAASTVKDAPKYDLALDLAWRVRKVIESTIDHEVSAFGLYYGLSYRQATDAERADGVWWDINEWRHLSYFTFKSILEGFGIRRKSASSGRPRPVFAVRDLDGELLPEWEALFDAIDAYADEVAEAAA